MQTVPDANDVNYTDLLTLLDENVEDGYKVLFDDPAIYKEKILHYPLSKKYINSNLYPFLLITKGKTIRYFSSFIDEKRNVFNSPTTLRSSHFCCLAKIHPHDRGRRQNLFHFMSHILHVSLQFLNAIHKPICSYRKTFICKNNVCGNHIKLVLFMDPGKSNQDLKENDDQLRYDENKVVKCPNCRSDLEECIELRCQREFQIASGTVISKGSFQQPICLVFSQHLMKQFNLGDTIQVAGYPRMILDSPILSKLKQTPLALYIDVLQAQTYSPIDILKTYNSELGAEVIDFLMNEFCLGGKLNNTRWRNIGLVSLAAHASNSSGSPIDVCFITDEVQLLKHLLHSIGCKSLDLAGEKFDRVKKRSCSSIMGKIYTISESGHISFSAEETLIFEITKSSSVKNIQAILELNRKSGMIGICPISLSRSKIGEVIKSFDIVVDLNEDCDRDDIFAEADAVLSLAVANTPAFNFSCYIKPKTRELISSGESVSLQRSYFIEKRGLIGKENETSNYPIYDPSRQLSLGISLSKAFAKLNGAYRVRKIDVYLGIIVQEVNLSTRFHNSVFKNQIQDDLDISTPLLLNQGLPSPCLSAKRHYSEANGYQHFKNIHGEVIESLCCQLGLSWSP